MYNLIAFYQRIVELECHAKNFSNHPRMIVKFCHLSQCKCTSFSDPSIIMLADKKSRNLRGTLYVKIEYLLQYPSLKPKFNDEYLNQTPQEHRFCTFSSLLM